MAEKASNKRGNFVLSHARHNQAIASMPEIGLIETCVAGEKRGIALLAQENDNLLVLQALAAKVDADLPCGPPRCLKQQALPVEDVLVEDDQA